MPRIHVRAVVLGSLLLAVAAAAAEESATEISRKSRERGALNLLDLTAELRLVTTSKDGKKKEQVLSASSRKIAGRTHSISRFVQPSSVTGVTVLTIEGEKGQPDEMSLYLPKLKRVRKVAGSERGKSFMDTDFSYADLAGTGARDDDVKRLMDQKVDGRDSWVLTGVEGTDSPYGKVTVFVDKETYVPLKVEYEDKAGEPFKRYRALKLKRFKDRTLAAESTMENLKTGSKTMIEVLRLEDSKLTDEAFSERALERG